jgi:hypothetical protein
MSETATEPLAEEVTTARIPIRNLWHMLLYAWNEVVLKNQWHSEIETSPSYLLQFWQS